MRIRLLLLLGLATGCFNPTVKSGGFLCDAAQSPACPSGFYCVNNVCVDHLPNQITADLAIIGGGGGGSGGDVDMSDAPADLSHAHHMHDLSPASSDLSTPSGGNTCSHPICMSGGSLQPSCDSCVAQVCMQDGYCCTTKWNSMCVAEVTSVCGKSCP